MDAFLIEATKGVNFVKIDDSGPDSKKIHASEEQCKTLKVSCRQFVFSFTYHYFVEIILILL